MEKSTLKQAAFIEKNGIQIPPTKSGCTRLIDFLINGNGTVGKDFQERVQIAKQYEKDWLNKRVRICRLVHADELGEEGTVTWLSARNADDVQFWREEEGVQFVHPFRAVVIFDIKRVGRSSGIRALSEIEIILPVTAT